jgi:hypothetical protein
MSNHEVIAIDNESPRLLNPGGVHTSRPRSASATIVACALGLSCGCGQRSGNHDATTGDDQALAFATQTQVLGSIAPGETRTAAYANPPLYRAFRFAGNAAETVDFWVRSGDGDAMAWVLDGNFGILAANNDADASTTDAHVVAALPWDGIFFITFRERARHAAHFTVSFAAAPDGGATAPLTDGGATAIDPSPAPDAAGASDASPAGSDSSTGGSDASPGACAGGCTAPQTCGGDGTPNRCGYVTKVFSGAAHVAAAEDHTCVTLTGDLDVKCWGNNDSDQLGFASNTRVSPPPDPTNLVSYDFLCTDAACALPKPTIYLFTGTYRNTWLINSFGEIMGSGLSAPPSPTGAFENDTIRAEGGATLLSPMGGSGHFCFVTPGGNLKWHCWGGSNTYFELGGTPWTLSMPWYPGAIEGAAGGIDSYVEMVTGGFFTCAQLNWLSAYEIDCWGKNDHGQLGHGTVGAPSQAQLAVVNVDAQNTHKLSAGFGHTCAVVAPAGDVVCWGLNDEGQIGDGTTTDRAQAVAVGLSGVTKVAAGGEHTCALVGGGVKCWGLNDRGQLGNGGGGTPGPTPLIGIPTDAPPPTVYSSRPVDVVGLSGAAVDIAVGLRHSCAVISDGTMQCWGFNRDGQLGDGTFVDRAQPTTVRQMVF